MYYLKQFLAMAVLFPVACLATGNGTVDNPWQSLASVDPAATAGTYHFDINNKRFSTRVENGWLLVVSGAATTPAQTYSETTDLVLQSDQTLARDIIASAFIEADELRINSSSGPLPSIDITSRAPLVLGRFRNYQALSLMQGEQALWNPQNGTLPQALVIACSDTPQTDLNQRIYHTSCNADGIHWDPGFGFERTARSNNGANDLNVWARLTPAGSINRPFTSLAEVGDSLPEGRYHFDIAGQQFSSIVRDGWVLAISGSAATAPATYAETSDLALQSDSTLPRAVFNQAFASVSDVRITSSGPAPVLDIRSSSATVLSRLRAYQTLSLMQGEQQFWQAGEVDPQVLVIACSDTPITDINIRIYHTSCNANGIHWDPGAGFERSARSNNSANDLDLWVKGGQRIARPLPAVSNGLQLWLTPPLASAEDGLGGSVLSSLRDANAVTQTGIYNFNINGQSFSSYVEDGWVLLASANTAGATASYTETNNIRLESDQVLSRAIVENALLEASEVRIDSRGGPAPALDIQSNDPVVLQRLRSFTTLSARFGEERFWQRSGDTPISSLRINCSDTALTNLSDRIYHTSCNGSGIHWDPVDGLERTAQSNNGSNQLNLWVRATALAGNTGRFALWPNQVSANALDLLQSDPDKQPRYDVNAMNFQPALVFDGSQVLLTGSNGLIPGAGNDALTIIAVANRTEVTAGTTDVASFTGGNATATRAAPALSIRNNIISSSISDNDGSQVRTNTAASSILLDRTYILGMRQSTVQGSPQGISMGLDGSRGVQGHALNNPVDATGSIFALGASDNNLREPFAGKIAEVLIYDRELSEQEYQSVNSYLALKYGITLAAGEDYVDAAGQTVFQVDENQNNALDASEFRRVAGLFKDASGGGDQRIARSQESDAVLTVSTDDNFADTNQTHRDTLNVGQYLVWGSSEESISNLSSSNLAAAYSTRVAREWKVQNTNRVGNVNLWFERLPELLSGQRYVLLGSSFRSDYRNPAVLAVSSNDDGIFRDVRLADGISYISVAITQSSETGTAAQPFSSLRSAFLAASAGSYHFNIGGQVFSTEVEDGWVLLVSGNGQSAPADYPVTTSLSQGVDGTLNPQVFFRLLDTQEVRIRSNPDHSTPIDIRSSSSLVISRLISYSTLSAAQGEESLWNAGTTSPGLLSINCSDSEFTPINRRIYHTSCNANGLHWDPGFGFERAARSNPEATDLSLWVRGASVATSIITGVPVAQQLSQLSAQSLVLNYFYTPDPAQLITVNDFQQAGLATVNQSNIQFVQQSLLNLSNPSIFITDLQKRIDHLLAIQRYVLAETDVFPFADLQQLQPGLSESHVQSLRAYIESSRQLILESGVSSLLAYVDRLLVLDEINTVFDTGEGDVSVVLLQRALQREIDAEYIAFYREIVGLFRSRSVLTLDLLSTAIVQGERFVRQLQSTSLILNESDFSDIGVSGVNRDNLAAVIELLKQSSALVSIASVQQLVDSLREQPAPTQNPFASLTPEVFAQLGITGVTEENIQQVRDALTQALIADPGLLTGKTQLEVIQFIEQVVTDVLAENTLPNALERLQHAVTQGRDQDISLNLLVNELGLENIRATFLPIYRGFILDAEADELATIEALQTLVERVNLHINALQEIDEDNALGNANGQRLDGVQLGNIIGLLNQVSSLIEQYRDGLENTDLEYQHGLPAVASINTVIALVNEQNRLLDTDGDGVSDVTEVHHGFGENDPDSPVPQGMLDSDGDGLSDAQEFILQTDSQNPDSDSPMTLSDVADNAVVDALEDFDQDGVSNIDELQQGSDPLVSDELTPSLAPRQSNGGVSGVGHILLLMLVWLQMLKLWRNRYSD